MNQLAANISQAQAAALSDPSSFAEYLTFCLNEGGHYLKEALATIAQQKTVIAQQDSDAKLCYTLGFSANAWALLFPQHSKPLGLIPFAPMTDGGRSFPATTGDIFIMIKSERMDLNFQFARAIKTALAGTAALTEDVQGYKYRHNRDMIDFVDGTENPEAEQRAEAILIDDDEQYLGGSYLTVQRYVEDLEAWNKQSVEAQEKIIGRTKTDDIELRGEHKPAYAHTKKSVVAKPGGGEYKMFRQNRPYGNALEHGTMFVGFAKSLATLETSLKQMITADDNGDYDRLLDFAKAVSGNHYFIPPQPFLDSLNQPK